MLRKVAVLVIVVVEEVVAATANKRPHIAVDEIIEVMLHGKATRQASNVSPLKKTYNDTLMLIPLDIEKAKELLAEAGWIDSDGSIGRATCCTCSWLWYSASSPASHLHREETLTYEGRPAGQCGRMQMIFLKATPV